MKNKPLKLINISILTSLMFLSSCNDTNYSKIKDSDSSSEVIYNENEFAKLLPPSNLAFDAENNKLTFNTVNGASGYEINVDGKSISKVTFEDGSAIISGISFSDGNDHLISIRSISETTKSSYASILFNSASSKTTSLYKFNLNEDETTITLSALNSQSSLKGEVIIPDTYSGYKVTKIGDGLFKDNKLVTSITLPEGIKEIGKESFANATNLKTITLPSTLEIIDENAFEKSKISKIEIPSSVKEIKANAFLSASTTAITFEAGSTLTTIGESAFASCKITSFTMPESVTTIGDYAFSGSSIKSFDFPANPLYTTLPNYIFAKCKSLINYTLPDFITELGIGTFSECSSLKTLIIPENSKITSFPAETFSSCTNLTFLGLEKDNTDSKTKTLAIPSFIKELGDNCFYKTAFETLDLSKTTITSIGASCFASNSKLTSISLPETLITLGNEVFSGDSKLSDITVSANIEYAGKDLLKGTAYLTSKKNQEIIFGKALIQASKENLAADSLTLDDSITMICAGCFASDSNLKSITLPANLKYIGDSAFSKNTKLENITLPASLIEIGTSAFESCSKLASVTFNNIENSVLKSIGESAFKGDVELVSFTLPNSVEVINANAFSCTSSYKNNKASGNSKLTTFTINNDSKLVSIGESAFSGLVLLESINLPNSLEEIGKEAFKNTSAMATISLDANNSNLKVINESAFINSGITNISLPKTLIRLEKEAFYNCNKLNNITFDAAALSEGEQNIIYENTFASCSSLIEINLPDCITTLEANVFKDDTSLLTINCLANDIDQTTFANTAFEASFEDGLIIYNEVLLAYTGKETNVTLPNTLKSISAKALYQNTTVETITFSSSVIEIEASAFESCTNLKKVIISGESGLKIIGASAFKDCKELKEIELSSNLETIGEEAFKNCINLLEINLNSPYLTTIEASTFENCNALTKVTLPKNLVEIKDYAFSKTSLSEITIPSLLTSIGNYAFANIGKADNSLVDASNWKITPSLAKISFPDNSPLNYIGKYAFTNNIVTSIDLPKSSDLTLDEYCFSYSTKLTIFSIDSGTNFSQGILYGSSSVTEVTLPGEESLKSMFGGLVSNIPNSLVKVNISEGSLEIPADSFAGLGMIQEINLPSTLTTIGEYAFYGCRNLKDIDLSHVEIIGNNAFNGCVNLDEINYSSSLKEIGNKAFQATGYLNNNDAEFVIINGILIKYNGSSSEVNIPDTVNTIAGGAFSGNQDVTKINLASSVTTLKTGAFDACGSLKELIINSSSLCEIELEIFDTMTSDFKVSINKNTLNLYEDDIYWSLYLDLISAN